MWSSSLEKKKEKEEDTIGYWKCFNIGKRIFRKKKRKNIQWDSLQKTTFFSFLSSPEPIKVLPQEGFIVNTRSISAFPT